MQNEISVMDRIGERIEAEGFDSLTAAERYYFAIWWLEDEANNGAFEQFFRNPPGKLAHEAVEGLRAVGAHQMADILQSAIGLFPESQVPVEREQRNRILDAFTPQQKQQLDSFSNEFTNYPDDLPSLLKSYVEEHKEQFLGPTTLLELWHARRARGAETQRRRLKESILAKETATDALFANRKCPMCDQPAPSYRKTCKRCGYPFGRDKKQQ